MYPTYRATPKPKPSQQQQTTITNAFRAQASSNANTLGRPSQSALNGSGKSSQSSHITSQSQQAARKRGISALSSAFDDSAEFRENIPPPVEEAPVAKPVEQLKYAMDLDGFEDCFSDDDDILLEINKPSVAPLIAAAERIPIPSATPVTKKTVEVIEIVEDVTTIEQPISPEGPPSSAPFVWSSSPPEERVPNVMADVAPKRPSAPKRAPVKAEKSNRRKSTEEADNAPTAKRRKLPWPKDTVEKKTDSEPGTGKRATARKTRETSAAKEGKGRTAMWNDTYGDFNKKRADVKRKNGKRTITTHTTDPEALARARKMKERTPRIFLSEEQKRVIDLVADQGKSVFFTGAAGTGKSVLLRELIKVLRDKYKKKSESVAVTASTGLAACNIGGMTLHSFAGIGLGKDSQADLVKKIKRNAKTKNRWLQTKVLIIDEVSMVDGDLFDKLEGIARQIRNNGRPFGGIQLVITGDFFQLPPVPDKGKAAKFAFDAETWNTSLQHTIGLTQVFRQRDPEFAEMLNQMREGKLTPESIATFSKLSRPIVYEDGIQATELFSTRTEVDRANNARMHDLSGKTWVFQAEESGRVTDVQLREKLLSSCMAPQRIELKRDSQVMLIKNFDDTLVNGSLGRVKGFMSSQTFDGLEDSGELDDVLDTNIPDSQLSDNLQKIRAHSSGKTPATDTAQKWPLVQFAMPDGTSRQLLCTPEQWKIELPNGEVEAQRSQIPLILAWALSIHKAQGQTLERVKVNLGKVFEKGQAYVALSRATTKEGLQVLNFQASKVMAHEKVRNFYAGLYSAIDAAKGRTGVATGKASAISAVPSKKKAAEPKDRGIPDDDEIEKLMAQGDH